MLRSGLLLLLALPACAAVEVSVAPLPTVPLQRQMAAVTVRNHDAAAVTARVELVIKPPVETARTTAATVTVPAGGSAEAAVPFELFEEGAHAVTVRVVVAGAEVATWTGTVAPVDLAAAEVPYPNRYRPAPTGEVVCSIDGRNRFLHQGRPWFPIGIYLTPASEKMAKELREAGFDLVMLGQMPPEAARKYLDAMQQWGLKVWTPLSHTLQFAAGDVAQKKADLTALVEAVGGHPALALWESIDEPAWGGQPAWGLREGYQFLAALDPQRPIWTNHAPRNTVQTLAWYNQATDVAGCDIYPVPMPQTQSNLPNKTLSVVGDETVKSVASVRGEKPVLMVLQGFAWANLSKRGDPKAVYPTFAESRYMAYDAILSGASGVLYWGVHYTPRPSPFWSDLKRLVSELRALVPVFECPTMTGRSAAMVFPETSPIRASLRAVNGEYALLLVNRSGEAVTAEVGLGAAASPRWRAVFDDPQPERVGARLKVSLPAWGVQVLTTNPQWRPERRDYTAEGAKAAATRPLVTEPGNALPNASFDQDDDGDGQPDGWQVRYPLTAELDREVKHGGEASLRLASETAGFRPLLVLNGVAVKRDAKYELSGWMRSDSPQVKARFYVEWTTDGKYFGGILPWTTPTSEWQRFSVPVTTTPNPAGNLYAVVQVDGPGRVWFDDLRLTEVE